MVVMLKEHQVMLVVVVLMETLLQMMKIREVEEEAMVDLVVEVVEVGMILHNMEVMVVLYLRKHLFLV